MMMNSFAAKSAAEMTNINFPGFFSLSYGFIKCFEIHVVTFGLVDWTVINEVYNRVLLFESQVRCHGTVRA